MSNEENGALQQYKTPKNLNTRISIHNKYSVNKLGFSNWLFSQYKLESGMRVLEVGCGNGEAWKGRLQALDTLSKLVLTDLSDGMLAAAKDALGENERLSFVKADVQALPFESASFDAVIANIMLYHVPDIGRGLSEIARVLSRGGCLYAATFGENGIASYVADMLKPYGCDFRQNLNFTLQNGEGILRAHFASVRKALYEDSLVVTCAEDLTDYILSLSGISSALTLTRDELTAVIKSKMVRGKLTVPKEYGMFICQNGL
ncbi:MAG: class I SAM-dependent methyltransferase [Eubacteriales bacterium]|nr:class I SAM-dependent methyltransferase [Eubacteriales bacterium]MDD3882440.1 class I SAM-dependent methyltransferase [Eubacteriales bacterium]MDD4513162.1 class I SAM-dependent methyltransferase [Eubacteriales bacterium]